MSSSLIIILVIAGVLILGVLAVLLMGRRSASTGVLSRETKASDRSTPTPEPALVGATADAEAPLPVKSDGAPPAVADGKLPVRYEPVDEEELGVTRRQVMNRGILAFIGIGALAPFGLSLLGFLWPTKKGGFGGKVTLDVSTTEALAKVAETKAPFYSPSARAYVNPYPENAIEAAKKVPQYKPPIIAGMENLGVVVLYQKCPHLGCKVPWCQSSQWFECPCHGSKYNRVGQKKGGPAPRGMDLFAPAVTSKDAKLVVDTGVIFPGPPPGVDTTNQGAEGPPCV